uniref:Methyltransferase type 11 domain-containing protein n=1 Tax=Ditylenchus dipsaci TaxID=166011 RepID=A0A915EP30_9BILA
MVLSSNNPLSSSNSSSLLSSDPVIDLIASTPKHNYIIYNERTFKKVDIIASGDKLPFPNCSQDFVLSSHVIEHFYDPIKTIEEWLRVVKPNGYVFIVVPHKERTFDLARNRTSLAELIERHEHPNPPVPYLTQIVPRSPKKCLFKPEYSKIKGITKSNKSDSHARFVPCSCVHGKLHFARTLRIGVQDSFNYNLECLCGACLLSSREAMDGLSEFTTARNSQVPSPSECQF